MKIFRSILSGVLLSAAISSVARAELISGIAAVVNDSIVTYQEVFIGFGSLEEQLRSQYRSDPAMMKQKVDLALSQKVADLVERQLILSYYKSAGFNIPESIIDDHIRDRIKAQFGDQATLTKTLQAQGKTREAYRREQRDQIIVDALRQEFTSYEKVIISPSRIEAYYRENAKRYQMGDQVKLRMIVLSKTGGTDPSAIRKLAGEIKAKLKDGAPFAEMASVYTDGAQRAQGGDRGWVDRDLFKKEITEAAFMLKAGETSDVIDLPEACYILFVEEARGAHVRPLSEVRDEIENILKAQGRERMRSRWVERLKAKAYVAYY